MTGLKLKGLLIPFLSLLILLLSFFGSTNFDGQKSGIFAPITAYADDEEEKDFESMKKLSEDMANEKGSEENAGNQWSRFGGGSRFFSLLTNSTSTASYVDLKSASKVEGSAGVYGFVLNRTGLDHSYFGGDIQQSLSVVGRFIGGGLIMGGYGVQVALDSIFTFITNLADSVNVLNWIGSPDTKGPFSGVSTIVYDLYQGMSKLGLIVTTVLFGISLGLAFLGWRISSRSPRTTMGKGVFRAYGGYLARLFIIIAAPLILATLYSSMLTQTKDAYKGSSGTDYAIYSNLVDFNAWVRHSRLALPDGSINGLVYSSSGANIPVITHKKILEINAKSSGLANASDALEKYNAIDKDNQGDLLGTSDGEGPNATAFDVLSRWTRSAAYRASDWESFAKSNYTGTEKEYKEAVVGDGSLDIKDDGSHYTYTTNVPSDNLDYYAAPIGDNGNAGLSSLGMYNYLLTVFDDTSLQWTSSESLANLVSAPSHASVGMVGRGVNAMGNYAMMFTLVWTLAILGIVFAAYAVNALIVSIPRIIGNLAASSFGSPVYFIKLMVAVFVVIIEVVGGAVLYAVSQHILIGVMNVSNNFFEGAFVSVLPENVALSGALSTSAYGAMNILQSFLIMYLAFVLLKNRGKVLSMFGEMMESALNNVFGMFEATEGARDSYAKQGGMLTADDNKNNSFGQINGGQSDSRQQGGHGGDANGSGVTNGKPGTRLPNVAAKSMLGKQFNKKQAMKDYVEAQEAGLGRGMTEKEKKDAEKTYRRQNAAIKVGKAVTAVTGSSKLQGLVNDAESIRDAKITEGLQGDKTAKGKDKDLLNKSPESQYLDNLRFDDKSDIDENYDMYGNRVIVPEEENTKDGHGTQEITDTTDGSQSEIQRDEEGSEIGYSTQEITDTTDGGQSEIQRDEEGSEIGHSTQEIAEMTDGGQSEIHRDEEGSEIGHSTQEIAEMTDGGQSEIHRDETDSIKDESDNILPSKEDAKVVSTGSISDKSKTAVTGTASGKPKATVTGTTSAKPKNVATMGSAPLPKSQLQQKKAIPKPIHRSKPVAQLANSVKDSNTNIRLAKNQKDKALANYEMHKNSPNKQLRESVTQSLTNAEKELKKHQKRSIELMDNKAATGVSKNDKITNAEAMATLGQLRTAYGNLEQAKRNHFKDEEFIQKTREDLIEAQEKAELHHIEERFTTARGSVEGITVLEEQYIEATKGTIYLKEEIEEESITF